MIKTSITLDLQPWQQDQIAKYFAQPSRQDAFCMGWLPVIAWHRAHEQRKVIACFNNGDPVGLCMINHTPTQTRIYQCWIQQDARLMIHGRALVTLTARIAEAHSKTTLGLWCREDLAANLFWSALGFEQKNWRYGRGPRPKRHLHWITSTQRYLLDLPANATRSSSLATAAVTTEV